MLVLQSLLASCLALVLGGITATSGFTAASDQLQHPNKLDATALNLQRTGDIIRNNENSLRSTEQGAFKVNYMSKTGKLVHSPGVGLLKIVTTPTVTPEAFSVARKILRLMMKYMPPALFDEVTRSGSVGLFTRAEKTTDFQEFAGQRDRPECNGTCTDTCRGTCMGPGGDRKWDSLPGLGGPFSTGQVDNFMCTDNNSQYYERYNVLVHEFSHTIYTTALEIAAKDYMKKLSVAYEDAKAKHTWIPSYAMGSIGEYFAEASGVFLNSNKFDSSGNMNSCNQTVGYCYTETQSRRWLKEKDPKLFDVLSYVYTDNRPDLPSHLRICMTK